MKFFFLRRTKKLLIFSFIVAILSILYYMKYQLPDIDALKTTQAQEPLRIYTADGKLIAEFGEKRSHPIPYDHIPKPLIDAVLATEDQRYFQHPGIDVMGLLRASVKLILTGRKEEGGSTITMQVARNFYLSRHKTFARKLQEILLAIKIDHGLPKEKILELYLNTIFLGNRAYGMGAAAEIYYGKPLSELSLDQFAMLAGLPKAPSALNPIANPEAAKKRRDHVLNRMYEIGVINASELKTAQSASINTYYHALQVEAKAEYVAEMAREQLEEMYGNSIYTEGLNVYTTIDSQLQNEANQAVHDNLIAYDERHGYRGSEKQLGARTLAHPAILQKILADIVPLDDLEPAIVVNTDVHSITALRANGSTITIPWQGLLWARKQINANYLGRLPTVSTDILALGDVIRIIKKGPDWRLTQIPKAQAGLVALNPQDGAIQALVGGFNFRYSRFNRITDAQRQPGSSFKPFIYSAALEKGFTLASIINDAPIVVDNPDNTVWRPQNDSRRFYGPMRLRDALVHSINLVSIRLLQQIEIPYTLSYLQRFGFQATELPPSLSLALGTASVSPLEMATAYTVFANGGFKVTPYLIDTIRNSQNKVIYQAKPLIACPTCQPDTQSLSPDFSYAPRVISAESAYLMTSVLHDVLRLGTASKARDLKRSDLAGKTGTTNNQVDAWFVGYNNQLVALSWMGFDQPQSLHEYGSQAALPLWMQFMQTALKGQTEANLPIPPGIVTLRINPTSGNVATPTDPDAIFEYFMQPYLPSDITNKPDGIHNEQIVPEQAGAVY
jgi:penicillin-binding protein 1A